MDADSQQSETDKESNPPSALFLLFKYCIGACLLWLAFYLSPLYGWIYGDLPECGSPEVSSYLRKAIPDASYKDFQQYDYKILEQTRYCRVAINDRVVSFKINWYGDEKTKFLLKLVD